MSGGIMGYLDACWGVSDAQWLDIGVKYQPERADFWSIAQVVPGELRNKGNDLARRWIDGEPPVTSLECWFRRTVINLEKQHTEAVEPWVIVYAMTHAFGGRSMPSPREYAAKVCMPVSAKTFALAVASARYALGTALGRSDCNG